MKSTTIVILCMLLAATAFAQAVVSGGLSPIPTIAAGTAVPDSSPQLVFLGPNIGTLTLSWPSALVPNSASSGRMTASVSMLNQVQAGISTIVTANSDGTYNYAYTVSNAPGAAHPIKVWSIGMPAIDGALSATHSSWQAALEQVSTAPNPPTNTVSMGTVALTTWSSPIGAAIPAGGSVTGFNVTSNYLPGFTIVYARSDTDYSLPANLPAQVTQQLAVMRQRDWMNQRLLAIGPRFPKGWTRDVIAADFKNGISRLVSAGILSSSSPFVAALGPALDALIASGGAPVPLEAAISAAASAQEKSIANAVSISLQ